MSDGRNYASWQPGAEINERLREAAGITTNAEYRKYLVENADEIARIDQMLACDRCCPSAAYPHDPSDSRSDSTPFLYSSCAETTKPYGYENSDLKTKYHSEYQLQCRLSTRVITQAQLLQRRYPNWN